MGEEAEGVTATAPERNALQVMGRVIGTYEGWDGDGLQLIYYAFKPCDVLASELPEGDLTVDYENGDFEFYNEDGSPARVYDAMELLNMVQRSE